LASSNNCTGDKVVNATNIVKRKISLWKSSMYRWKEKESYRLCRCKGNRYCI